jgi:cytochrome c-type protein NapC
MVGNKTITTNRPLTKTLLLVAITFTVGASFSSMLGFVLNSTNDTEFCTGCHSMQWSYQQLQETSHWKNRSGMHAGCADCHVPREFWPRLKTKLAASKDLWHEITGSINTPEKFEARRWQLANRVWEDMKETNSRECRNCHLFEHMDYGKQTDSAIKEHSDTDSGKTCIDCHKGIAHKLPDEPNHTGNTENN